MSKPERTKIFESGKEKTREGQRVRNSLGSRSGSLAAVTFFFYLGNPFPDSCFPDSKYLRVLPGEEDCFGEDAAVTDAKRRPGFHTWSPRRPLPDPCYLCDPRFLRSSTFLSIRVH
jgi:hypothetical protein